MNIALWIVAGLLATAYFIGGWFKVLRSKAQIAAAGHSGAWVEDFSAGGVKAIGGLEVVGALGLILPAALGIAEVLTPVAALGLAVIMVGAAIVRLRRREFGLVPVDVVYLVLLVFVAWGRFAG